MVFWVRYGTRLYQFLIFAFLTTFLDFFFLGGGGGGGGGEGGGEGGFFKK